jgi:hypothetical protein
MQTAHLENLKVRLLFDLWRVVVMNYQSLSSQTRLALRGDDPLDHLDLAASMLSATWSRIRFSNQTRTLPARLPPRVGPPLVNAADRTLFERHQEPSSIPSISS